MSDATWQAVEDAIAAHVADEADGAMLTLWALAATGMAPGDAGGRTRYVYAEAEGQWHSIFGLHDMHRDSMERRFQDQRRDD